MEVFIVIVIWCGAYIAIENQLYIFRYYHYSAHSVADCMEDVTLLAPAWEREKDITETSQETDQEEEAEEVEAPTGEDDASKKDEL